MAKRRRKAKRNVRRSEDEFRDAGENFGKYMEKRGREFGEEIKEIADRFGNHVDERRRLRGERKYFWFGVFGPIGPLIGSIFGIVLLALGIFALNLINIPLQSIFLSSLSNFIFSNLQWFFVIFLFFGYNTYLKKRFPRAFWTIAPITIAIGFAVMLWIGVLVLDVMNYVLQSSLIAYLSYLIYSNLFNIFVILAVLGYIVTAIKFFIASNLGR